jgi:hypothetical protein
MFLRLGGTLFMGAISAHHADPLVQFKPICRVR